MGVIKVTNMIDYEGLRMLTPWQLCPLWLFRFFSVSLSSPARLVEVLLSKHLSMGIKNLGLDVTLFLSELLG